MIEYVIYDREVLPDRPDGDYGWTEPESAASLEYPPVYPYNNITQTESGHMFEMDDTPGGERVRIHHRSGTFIEMHPNGDEVHKIYGNGYEIISKNKNVLIKGVCSVTIENDCLIQVYGNRKEVIYGNHSTVVKGDYDLVVQGKTNITSPSDMKINGGGETGFVTITAGQAVNINSDLLVDGAMNSQSVTTVGRIDTGPLGGISAGIQGFVSELGGIGIGIPIAVPGTIDCALLINCFGAITAEVSMAAPSAEFGTMAAVLMTDVVNTSIYDFHFHFGFSGPTSTPVPAFIGV